MIPILRASLINAGHATEEQLADLEAQIDRANDEAAAFAFASEFAGIEELRRDVYAEELTP